METTKNPNTERGDVRSIDCSADDAINALLHMADDHPCCHAACMDAIALLKTLKSVKEDMPKRGWIDNAHQCTYPRIIGGENLTLIATTEGSHHPVEERKAAARLISAAPDLLSACKALVEPRTGGNKKEQLAAARQSARKAIARAEHYIQPNVGDQGSAPCTNAATKKDQPNEN